MPGLRLLVALPGTPGRSSLLTGRQAIHAVTDQNAVHGGACNAELMEALQISGNPAWSKVVTLPQIQDLGDDFPRRLSG